MRTRSLPALLALSGVLLLGGGCLYRMDIQQGNVLNTDQVVQLQTGMTRPQVMFLLGTPMVPNGFDTDRWDYYYYNLRNRSTTPTTRRLTVYFKDERVERIDGLEAIVPPVPAAAPTASAAAAP
jgi:outer membrane protein assembly factor BamE